MEHKILIDPDVHPLVTGYLNSKIDINDYDLPSETIVRERKRLNAFKELIYIITGHIEGAMSDEIELIAKIMNLSLAINRNNVIDISEHPRLHFPILHLRELN